ncbi:MAG: T9SS type A sorting domain-containing protein, partial [Gemmatimonadetes bacterium]|nr:T9SS type A sorting domain-containing protein [Gemmatimonadota bacterium]
MKSLIGSFIGLVLSVSVGAEPLLEGRVRLSSGQPAAGVQVRLFDLTDLRRFVGTTTDETGHFALPLRTFSTPRGMALPTDFALGQNYPNPFNPSTVIPYQLPTSAHVRLEVFNLLGQRLATLVDAEQAAGIHTAQWDATDAAGRAVGAGVYIYRLSSGEMTESRRMVLVDGQAGIPAAGAAPVSVRSAGEGEIEADGSVYGLTVSGEGLVAYVNPTFRVGVDEVVDIAVEEHSSARMKLAADGVLGDVDGNGQVDVFDVLYVLLYSVDPSIVLPNYGDISRGDVNGDGLVDVADAVLLLRYLSNPSDPALPLGIGQDPDGTLDGATQVDLGSSTDGSLSEGDTDYFRVEMSSAGTLIAYTTGSVDTEGAILDSSGTVLARNSDSGAGYNFEVYVPVDAGTYYIEIKGWRSSTTGDYTLHVVGHDEAAPVETEYEEEYEEYVEAVGLIVRDSGTEIVRVESGQVTGEIEVGHGLKTDLLSVGFIAEDGDLFTPDAGDGYALDWEIADESIAEVEHHAEDGAWAFHIIGLAEGQTTIRIKINYEDHADFVSPEIEIHVEESGPGFAVEITPEVIGLYSTLVTSLTDIFFAALVPGTTSVPGEGGGSVEIYGNDWTLQDYSPDGALIINGALNIDLTQTPIPLRG